VTNVPIIIVPSITYTEIIHFIFNITQILSYNATNVEQNGKYLMYPSYRFITVTKINIIIYM